MMRFHRVSPDYVPLTRMPVLRTCKEEDLDISGRIPSLSTLEGKVLGARPETNASTAHDHRLFSEASINSGSANVENHAAPISKSPSPHESSGDILLQWGHKKRTRGSRADSRTAAVAEESLVQSRRRPFRSQRRLIGVSDMPPPSSSYTRGVNLRSCTAIREVETLSNRAPQERSGGPSSQEKRSPPSPPEKFRRMGTSTESSLLDGHVMDSTMKPDPARPSPSDQETGGRRSGSVAAVEKVSLDKMEWPRIYLSLSRKEKEEDFLAMKGTKLPQRPKKRPKNIDKSLQYVFPGMWLYDVTRGRYEVREKRCSKKVAMKRRGLKGMESMDSDSE